nr:MAG TPA: hypothetical protein [Caudoviricetes sp.]
MEYSLFCVGQKSRIVLIMIIFSFLFHLALYGL